jgi:hypothetical protein
VSRRLTYEEVQRRIEERSYKLLSKEYFRNSDKLEIKCPKGHVFKQKLNDFCNGHGCPHCAGLARHSFEYIKEQVEKEGFILLETEYKNAKTKMNMICPNGHHVYVNWNNFSNGFRCQKCGRSKGEETIAKYLDEQEIEYVTQHTFKDCKNVYGLPFDFYIPSLNICIEYDGEQHFKPTRFGSMTQEQAEQGFVRTQQNDNIKNEYCKKNNIQLIRIPYTDFKHIHTILKEQL